MSDDRQDPLERLFRHMDGEAPLEPEDLPEGSEELIEFDEKIRKAIPPVSAEDSARLDEAFARARGGEARAPAARSSIGRWAVITTAIAATLALIVFLTRPPRTSIGLEFAILDTTRSGGASESISYRMQAVFREAAYWYVLERDENDRVQPVFPFFDAEGDRWDYLGYEDNYFEAGSTAIVPRPEALSALVASGTPGATEHIFAVASREPVELTELLELVERLEGKIASMRSDGGTDDELVTEIEARLRSRFGAVRTSTRTYGD